MRLFEKVSPITYWNNKSFWGSFFQKASKDVAFLKKGDTQKLFPIFYQRVVFKQSL